ncbi:MAG: hypothetical protein H3C33_06300 [Rhodocyclaceae bacterium]|jgi:hypothetical protein|nr:hypothetical protein [Rhodocyclaceae bacterium]
MNRRQVLRRIGVASIGMAMLKLHEALAAGRFGKGAGVVRVRGDVRINGRPAQVDQLIRTGDRIETGKASEAVYVVGRDAFLQRESTQVSFPEGDGEFLIRTLRVVTGRILSVFDKGDKRLEIPHATIGIRGTGGYVWAEGGTTYFCLCYGVADIEPDLAPEQGVTIETQHHDSPFWITPGHPEGILRRAPVIDHSDAELTLLENLVGRWPPFYIGSGDGIIGGGY